MLPFPCLLKGLHNYPVDPHWHLAGLRLLRYQKVSARKHAFNAYRIMCPPTTNIRPRHCSRGQNPHPRAAPLSLQVHLTPRLSHQCFAAEKVRILCHALNDSWRRGLHSRDVVATHARACVYIFRVFHVVYIYCQRKRREFDLTAYL